MRKNAPVFVNLTGSKHKESKRFIALSRVFKSLKLTSYLEIKQICSQFSLRKKAENQPSDQASNSNDKQDNLYYGVTYIPLDYRAIILHSL